MNQPIIVDQAKHQEVREATDFIKKYRDFDFSSLPEEEFLETLKAFHRHSKTIINALQGLVSDIDADVQGEKEGAGVASPIGNPAITEL